MDLYIHAPIRLHGLVLNKLSTRTTLPLHHETETSFRSCHLLNYSRNSQNFVEPEGSLPGSQEPSTGPYPESDQFSPLPPHIISLFHFNIIFPLPSGST
jgi:hypothetical protein